VLLILLFSGCETAEVWQENNNDKYVEVIPASGNEDIEAYVQATKQPYYCRILEEGSGSGNKVCYVKPGGKAFFKDIQLKLFKTPKAVATDVGTFIQVIGYFILEGNVHLYYEGGIH
jgi:hypothetical protein